MARQVMIAVHPETKEQFRGITFPAYLKTDDSKIRFIVDYFDKNPLK